MSHLRKFGLRFLIAINAAAPAQWAWPASGAVAAGGPRPEAVSPGKPDRIVELRDGCSTFSWSAVDGARSFALAVHRIEYLGAEVETGAAPVLSLRVPATLSWTPALEECLSAGRYAWVVRAQTAGGWSDWSEARLFEVRGSEPQVEPRGALQSARPARAETVDVRSPAIVEFQTPAGERLLTSAPQRPRPLTGPAFSPPSCNGGIFSDVTGSNPNCSWIEQLAADEIAQPCVDGPPGSQRFCPDHPVTRGQIAGLLERAMRGTDAWRAEQGDGPSPNLPPAPPGITPLHAGGDTGQHTSITVGADGLGLIAYREDGGIFFDSLRVAHCSNIACTAATSMPIGVEPAYTSITIGADGFGLISYYDGLFGDLKVAHCANVECTSVDASTPLDSDGDVGQYTSITIGADGLGLISYYDATNGDLKVVHCTNAPCTTHDTPTTLDSTDDVGSHTAIAIGADGLALISYHRVTDSDLKVVHCTNANCTTADPPTALDTTGNVGNFTSLTIGADGLGLISYFDDSKKVPKVAHCSDTKCTTATITELEPFLELAGWYTSITIGADGLGLISYYDFDTDDLKVAHCSNVDCTAATITRLDTGGDVGQYTSITTGADGLGLISYYDATNGALKVAHCSNVLCARYFRRR